MTPKNRLMALLGKGYFPQEIPAVFTTRDFGAHAADVLNDWRSGSLFSTTVCSAKQPGKAKFKLSGSYSYKLKDTDLEVISKPKRGYERRNIHITHPIPQALLAYEIAEHWEQIAKWLLRQRYSLDRLSISQRGQRPLDAIGFSVHAAKKAFIEATSDWLIKTDITRFYPSIYTHSIAWAAYGKEKVKGALNLYTGSLADRIDILVRNCNRNQTVGIPIGPDTSRIIAEILSSRIDEDFYRQNPSVDNASVDRLQDDWFIGAGDLHEAERILSSINKTYRAYGLEINGSKTFIDRVVANTDDAWLSELTSFLLHASGKLRARRLREFLNLVIRLQVENHKEPVAAYALSIIESRQFSSEDVEPLESFLLKCMSISPGAMDKICRILVNIDRTRGHLSAKRLNQRITHLAERTLENGNHYEALWLIYTLRGLRQRLTSRRVAELVEDYAGATVPLVLLDMKSKGLFSNKLPTTEWENNFTLERIESDWTWLLVYEGARKGWLVDRHNLLQSRFLKPLNDRDIVFYDPTKNVQASSNAAKFRTAMRKIDNAAIARFLLSARGFSHKLRLDY